MKKLLTQLLPENPRRRNLVLLALFLLTLTGFILRILCCFWGYPYQLHGDEHTIVDNAIDMLARHSYEVHMYARPDHFEIKCCALLFQIVSYLRYHVPAYEAFAQPNHVHLFYLTARAYTAVWGTLMIPLFYLLTEKCRKGSGLAGAAMAAFFPLFVRHSAYATPDIVLTFFIMALVLVSMLYTEEPSLGKLAVICALTGIGITIKYPCAIACLWIAFIVCRDGIRRKAYLDILKYGLFSVFAVIAACFVISPNLITNLPEVAAAIRQEARTVHLGADGLGMWGNFRFYLQVFVGTLGIECVPFLILGAVYVVRKHTLPLIHTAFGLLFWLCMSYLPLHWERWGMPIYVFLLMTVLLGFFFALDLARSAVRTSQKRILFAAAGILFLPIALNTAVSGAWTVRFSLMEDSRVAGKRFCDDNFIVESDTVYDGYSPLSMSGSMTIDLYIGQYGELTRPADKPNAQFFIVSSAMYGRFYAEPERYASVIQVYDAIEAQCRLVYRSDVYSEHSSPWASANLFLKLYDFAHSAGKQSGPEIKIYWYPGPASQEGEAKRLPLL